MTYTAAVTVIALVALQVCLSTALSIPGKLAEEDLKCHYSEEIVMSGSCDPSCDNGKPPCMFTKILKPRCGCPPGHVRDSSRNCIKVWRCPNRENLPTQCQLASLMNNQITCDEDGLFTRKQTIDRVSTCVVPQTGSKIPGKEGEQVDCDVMQPCQKEYEEVSLFFYNNPGVMDGPSVHCSSSGNYRRRQCVSFTDSCKCVNPKTGTAIPGLEFVGPHFKCKKVEYTECQKEFLTVDEMNMESGSNVPLPVCSAIDGKYPVSECDQFGICQCRNRENGKFLPGRGANINCAELTSCQQQSSSDNSLSCDNDGRYFNIQCNNDYCHCVDPDTGVVDDSVEQVPISDARDLKCPTPTCPANMIYMTCHGCDITCGNKDTMFMCTMMCRSKCACPGRMVWSHLQKTCVEEDNCEPPPVTENRGGLVMPPDLAPPPLPDMPAVMPAMPEVAVMPAMPEQPVPAIMPAPVETVDAIPAADMPAMDDN